MGKLMVFLRIVGTYLSVVTMIAMNLCVLKCSLATSLTLFCMNLYEFKHLGMQRILALHRRLVAVLCD